MKYMSLFSGIEAATVAWQPLGWECVAVAEIEPFPAAVLAHHYPAVPNLGDVTKITSEDIAALGKIDLVVFGSPCQDLSVAGKRLGFDGERSGLFTTATRIVRWAREHCGCRFALWENVPGAFSSNQGRDFAVVVEQMAGCRHVEVPKNGWGTEGAALGDDGLLEWSTLDAQWFGVAQRRRRVFALADFGDWASRRPILLEPDSLRGDSPPSREARKETTGSIGDCSKARREWPCDVSSTLDDHGHGQENVLAYGIPGNWIGRAPENGGNAVEPMMEVSPCQTVTDRHAVAFAENTRAEVRLEGGDGQRTGALSTGGGKPGQGVPCVAYITKLHNTGSNPQPGDPCHPLAAGAHPPAIAFQEHRGAVHAHATKARSVEVLRALRYAVGEEAFAIWSLGVLAALQPAKVLQSSLHGTGFRSASFSRSWVVHCALSRSQDGSGWLLQSLRETGCEGCPPQGWEPSEQLSRELGAYLSELSQPGAQASRFVRDLWEASEGVGLLRQALSAIQEVGRPAGGQGQSILGSSEGRREKADENVLSSGMQCEVSRERVLHETCATGEARDSREGTDEQERSGKGRVGETPFAVRRLTVEECEFLQGFPRGYTAIPWRKKPASECPDGPRYKALGNSMAVPVMRWIGRQIEKAVRFEEGHN